MLKNEEKERVGKVDRNCWVNNLQEAGGDSHRFVNSSGRIKFNSLESDVHSTLTILLVVSLNY